MSTASSSTGDTSSSTRVEVPVLVIQIEAPNILYVRRSPLSDEDRTFLKSIEDYCGHVFASSSSSRWRSSLNERNLNIGDKYFALDSRLGGSQWRRGILTNVVTVRGGHRACIHLMDEARSIDVAMNHILPMPDTFGNRAPLLRKVVISGIRPCTLVTDSLTCETDYGPSSSWDGAAEQYCKKLFLFNPGLSDVRLHSVRFHSSSQLCLADLSFRVDEHIVSSYALHLKQMRFATDDDEQHSFALSAAVVNRPQQQEPAGLVPPFQSSSSLTLMDDSGSVVKCHKVDSDISLASSQDKEIKDIKEGDANNNNLPDLSVGGDKMQITFDSRAKDAKRSVLF